MIKGACRFAEEARILRHRLRFLLQELDLPPGEALIGRSPDCLITLDDPLVSRRHGRLVSERGAVTYEDLGSRNGSRINGQKVQGVARLHEGDRIRIGAHELVYCVVSRSAIVARTPTGQLRRCSECSSARPEEVMACPTCGATEWISSENTLSGQTSHGDHDWALYLLTGLVTDALARGQTGEAERLFRLAMASVDAKSSIGQPLFLAQIDPLLEALIAILQRGGGSTALLQRTLSAYASRDLLPSVAAIEAMERLGPRVLDSVSCALEDLSSASWPKNEPSSDRGERLVALERLRLRLRRRGDG